MLLYIYNHDTSKDKLKEERFVLTLISETLLHGHLGQTSWWFRPVWRGFPISMEYRKQRKQGIEGPGIKKHATVFPSVNSPDLLEFLDPFRMLLPARTQPSNMGAYGTCPFYKRWQSMTLSCTTGMGHLRLDPRSNKHIPFRIHVTLLDYTTERLRRTCVVLKGLSKWMTWTGSSRWPSKRKTRQWERAHMKLFWLI